MTTSSNRTARRGAARRVPAPAGRPQKPSEYTGVRLRQWGRWAAEVRVPGTRQKLWIGTFETDRQAALAYDAAVFCFYGVHLPSRRRFNYPGAPRPDIPAWVRVQPNVASVKAVAERGTPAPSTPAFHRWWWRRPVLLLPVKVHLHYLMTTRTAWMARTS